MARIGSIITVTQSGLLYRDIAEITRWIDFRRCHDVYCLSYAHTVKIRVGPQGMRCVGRHSFHLAPLAYIEFFTDPITRLEFDEHEDLWNLLKQMRLYGAWFAVNID